MKKPLKLPDFKTKDEEREFWAKVDLNEYFEPEDFMELKFLHLKPSTQTISLRLPYWLLQNLKTLAQQHDVAYQTLIKLYLAERVRLEMRNLRNRENPHTDGPNKS